MRTTIAYSNSTAIAGSRLNNNNNNNNNRKIIVCKRQWSVRILWMILMALTILWNSQTLILIVRNDENNNNINNKHQDSTSLLLPPRRTSSSKTTNPQHNLQKNGDNGNDSLLFDSLYTCIPTHHACDNYHGIYHIKMGDYGGAGGTIFFQFVIGQLMYAEQYNLLPFVHLDNFSHLVYDPVVHNGGDSGGNGDDGQPLQLQFQALEGIEVGTTQDSRWHRALYPGPPVVTSTSLRPHTYVLNGTGVWDHYFARVSDYCPGDTSCATKPYLTMTKEHVSPGLHLYAPWAPKIWRYGPMPDFVGKPHVPLKEWLLPQRLEAARVVEQYFQFQPNLSQQANPEITNNNNNNNQCLGMHIRWSDKGGTRRIVQVSEFLPYAQAYLDQYYNNNNRRSQQRQQQLRRPCIYIATDSLPVLDEIKSTWPKEILSNTIYSQASIRSPNQTAVFDMVESRHHVTNTEVLRDVLELSRCGFLIHGKSAVSESAMYLNPRLIYQSVSLEDDDDDDGDDNKRSNSTSSMEEFKSMVEGVLSGTYTLDYWKTTKKYNLSQRQSWWQLSTSSSLSSLSCPADANVTVPLRNEEPYSFAIRKFVNRMFVQFWKKLATEDVVTVDPYWQYWMQTKPQTLATTTTTTSTNSCQFSISTTNMPDLVRDAIIRLANALSSTNNNKGKKALSFSRQENFANIRADFHMAMSHLMEVRPHIQSYADQIWNNRTLATTSHSPPNLSSCLGLYISDPGYHRDRKIKDWVENKYPEATYDAYIETYIQVAGADGGEPCIYLASDSYTVWDRFRKHITSTAAVTATNLDDGGGASVRRTNVLYTQRNAVRNRRHVPAHYMEEDINRLGSETLVDILNLGQCRFVVHGGHPIAEVALMQNPQVESIHVQDPNRLDVDMFSEMVRGAMPR